MSAYTDIEVEIDDPVAIIRLNRPEKLNALSYHTLDEFRRAVEAAAADPRVVGIVVTGAGRGFSSGLDSMALAEVTSDGGQALKASNRDAGQLPGLFTFLLDIPKPVIAAINGVAAGGGLILALKCDVRIASRNASFTTIFLKRGLVAEHGVTWLLPRLTGTGAALDLLWTSRRIDAEEALRLGIVEYVVEPDELIGRAKAYVRMIAANSAPNSMAETKALVYKHQSSSYQDAFRDADAAQWVALARPDAAEGAQALLEKREPRFKRLGET